MQEGLCCDDRKKLSVSLSEIIKILAFIHLCVHDGFLNFNNISLDVLAKMK